MGAKFYGGYLHLGSYAWNKLYDRRVFDQVRFPDGKKYEDMYIILQLLHNATSFRTLPECKYYYVQREGSIVHEIGTVNLDFLAARKKQLEKAKSISLDEENLKLLEMLVVKAYYNVYRDILRLPASKAASYHDMAQTCKDIVHSEMFKGTPFSFKRRFWMKIWTAPFYRLFWKWKRQG